jgi:hypothetical protein
MQHIVWLDIRLGFLISRVPRTSDGQKFLGAEVFP